MNLIKIKIKPCTAVLDMCCICSSTRRRGEDIHVQLRQVLLKGLLEYLKSLNPIPVQENQNNIHVSDHEFIPVNISWATAHKIFMLKK